MFERFDEQARRVIAYAQEEARLLNHNYIGTEHILLGIAREDEGVAVEALLALGVSLTAIRQQVEMIIGTGSKAPSGHIPFTPRAKKVLELALREALQLGHNDIGAEHILLGLIREGEGVAAQVLVRLGADLNRVRRQVIQLVAQHEGSQDAPEHQVRLRLVSPGPHALFRLRGTSSELRGAKHGGWEAQVIAVLADIQRRLTVIERRLGISEALGMTAADEPEQPPNSAAPGPGGPQPADGPDSRAPGDPAQG